MIFVLIGGIHGARTTQFAAAATSHSGLSSGSEDSSDEVRWDEIA